MESAPKIETCNLEDWLRAKTIADVSDSKHLSFQLSGMIADDPKNLGYVGKIETLPIPIALARRLARYPSQKVKANRFKMVVRLKYL